MQKRSDLRKHPVVKEMKKEYVKNSKTTVIVDSGYLFDNWFICIFYYCAYTNAYMGFNYW